MLDRRHPPRTRSGPPRRRYSAGAGRRGSKPVPAHGPAWAGISDMALWGPKGRTMRRPGMPAGSPHAGSPRPTPALQHGPGPAAGGLNARPVKSACGWNALFGTHSLGRSVSKPGESLGEPALFAVRAQAGPGPGGPGIITDPDSPRLGSLGQSRSEAWKRIPGSSSLPTHPPTHPSTLTPLLGENLT